MAPLALLFLVVDLSFFVANLTKIADGGWIPLTLGITIFVIMVTWRTGVTALRAKLASLAEPVDSFLAELKAERVPRVPGTAIFLTRPTDKIPAFVGDYVRNMGSLHKVVLALHIRFEEQPRIDEAERAEIEQIAPDFWHVTLRYGFIEAPDLVSTLRDLKGVPGLDPDQAVFFATRDLVAPARHSVLSRWRLALFAYLYRNAARLTDRFNLPQDRTVEVARQVRL